MKKISLLLVLIIMCQLFALPIIGSAAEPEHGHYLKITSVEELEDNGKYLLVYNSTWKTGGQPDHSGIVSPENGVEGFPVTAVYAMDELKANYEEQEWTFTKDENGWKIGNGNQYAKVSGSAAVFDDTGDVFTITLDDRGFRFVSDNGALNYHEGTNELAGWTNGPAPLYIYKYVSASEAPEQGCYTKIKTLEELQNGEIYILAFNSQWMSENQPEHSGIMAPISGSKGFSIIAPFASDRLELTNRGYEWIFTKDENGWKIGNGGQYVKARGSTAVFDADGTVFTVTLPDEKGFRFESSDGVLNYNEGANEMAAYSSGAAPFYIYKYSDDKEEEEHYTKITSTDELQNGESYLLIYNSTWTTTGIEHTGIVNTKPGSIGFPVEPTNEFSTDKVITYRRGQEWTFAKSGNGWKIGDGEQYVKLNGSTAMLDADGTVFTITLPDENGFRFESSNGVFNYNEGANEMAAWENGAAPFYIYKYVEGAAVPKPPEPTEKPESTEKPDKVTVVDDNFESYTSVNDMTAYEFHDKSKSAISSEINGNKYFRLDLTEQTDALMVTRSFDSISGDRYMHVKLRVRTTNPNLTVPVFMINATRTIRIMEFTKGGAYTDEEREWITDIEADRWYTIEAVFDVNAKTYEVTVTDDAGKVSRSSVVSYEGLNNFSGIRVNCWNNLDASVQFDDILVEDLKEKPELEEASPDIPETKDLINDDFEKYSSINDMSAYNINIRDLCEITDFNGNKAFKMGLTKNTDNIQALRSFSRVQDGIVECRVKVMTTDTSLVVPMFIFSADQQKEIRFMEFTKGGAYVNNEKDFLAPIKEDEWYEIYAEFNINAQTYIVTMTDKNGNVTKRDSISFADDGIKDLGAIRLQCWDHMDASVYFDDLRVRYVVANPEINDNSVVFYDVNGNESTNRINVSTQTSRIVVDFKTYMDTDSYEGIKLISRNTNEEVKATINKTQRTYEMQLDKLLDGNTVYVLTIPGTVKSYGGISLGKTTTVTFVTSKATNDFSIGIESISCNNKEISDLSGLIEAGGDTQINLKYLNGTQSQNDVDVCIITSYYSGEKLIRTMVSEECIDKNTTNALLTYDLPIADISDVDCIKVFVVDTIKNINPYCDNFVFE